MGDDVFYRLLERPLLYHLSQVLLAPGAEKAIRQKIDQLLARLRPARWLLDVGCGPSSWLWWRDLHPVGLDLSLTYTGAFGKRGEPAVCGSAAALPFRDGAFDGVWSVGLLHHLPDDIARQAICEMVRVTSAGGYVLILDAVLPEPIWRRPMAYAVRRLDRGRFVRRQAHSLSLLSASQVWAVERFDYTMTGLELLGCYLIHQPGLTSEVPQRAGV